MIKTLLKKQMSEIFRGYFFDMKNNKARSKVSTLLYFALFAFLMIILMTSVFGVMAYSLIPIVTLGFGWLYYGIIGLIAVLFGVFGSVFSTYSGLYLAKDNDLLLSMPIPVRVIMTSRLLGVYLMGLLYSSIVMIPAVAVRFILCEVTVKGIFGALLFTILISLFVLALSCIFGYAVARISLKLKNKSFITVILSLAFFAGYYYVYFNANTFLKSLIENIAVYGDTLKNRAYPVFVIGMAAEGEWLPAAAVTLFVIVILVATLCLVSHSFVKIATSNTSAPKVKYRGQRQNVKSAFGALLSRELKRFTGSPNYMLNCGLGLVFMIAAAVLLIVKADFLRELVKTGFAGYEDIVYVAVAAAVCLLSSTADTAAPSVALEGKTLWQIRALPVSSKAVLKAKYMLQIYLSVLPALFLAACAVSVLRPGFVTGALLIMFSAVYTVFNALYCLYCGLHKVNLNWTNEVVPIKQSMSVMFALFGGWGIAAAVAAPYFFLAPFVSAKIYIAGLTAIIIILSALLYNWINKKGTRVFESL